MPRKAKRDTSGVGSLRRPGLRTYRRACPAASDSSRIFDGIGNTLDGVTYTGRFDAWPSDIQRAGDHRYPVIR